MTRFFRLLLLFGALFGLLGQQTTFAASMPASSVPAAAMQMSADCMEMMQGQKSLPAKKPCNGMFDCMAAMGCVAPMAIEVAPVPLSEPRPVTQLAYWLATSVLVGTNHVPEPDPPTILA